MENIIPINGRIAIVDDKIDQALPLMQVLSKNNIPYTFYDGSDSESFPETPENDIRILFLDLNLLGGKLQKEKEVKSSLINTLSHLLSPDNYPYVVILWSRQENEYKKVVEEIFNNELKNRAPIAIESYIKSDFFPNFAEEIDDTKDKCILFEKLKSILMMHPAYCHLMQWENIVHTSSDDLLKHLFPNVEPKRWEVTTNTIIESLGQAYLGQHFYDASAEEKTKASLLTLNMVLVDSIDKKSTNCSFCTKQELDNEKIDKQTIETSIAELNYKLNFFEGPNNICEPGVVFQYNSPKVNYFEHLLHKIISLFSIRSKILCETPDILETLLKKETDKKMKQIKQDIQQTWIKIGVVVTPSCDFAQKKKIYDRIVQGVMIESRFEGYINQGDAFYTSPVFRYKDNNYIIVLNFNYFTTSELNNDQSCTMLYKIRRTMLSEIQSKLARHINRQGVMSL